MRKVLVFSLLFVSLAIPASGNAATCSDRTYDLFIECVKLGIRLETIIMDLNLLRLYSEKELQALIRSGEKCLVFENDGRGTLSEACKNRMRRQLEKPHDR